MPDFFEYVAAFAVHVGAGASIYSTPPSKDQRMGLGSVWV